MSDMLKFGLIGCGGQGRYLSEALAMTGLGAVVACADLDTERAGAMREWLGASQAFPSAADMLAGADLDAVIVATVHDQLQPCALQAVRAGKHVLVEKPMALNAADGRALVVAAEQAGVNLMVGYTLRFMADRILMKRLLDEGAIGEPVHIIAGQLIGNMGGWLSESAHGGGPLMYVGCHVLDNVLWVAGRRAERVYAEVQPREGTDVEASTDILIHFEGGLNALVSSSQRMGGRYGWLDVIGSRGRLRAQWESSELYVESQVVEAYRRPTRIDVPPDGILPPVERNSRGSVVAFKYLRNWAAELHEFCSSITEGRPPSVPGEDGVRVLEVMDAVFESGGTGAPVTL
ncbi:MAG TPA: Gfo/Idh/MocA family oxidoreductase [Armatimonadota bacterium]|nr:Gfo/Idh/MocA family oxidoreductase [Armatimonadota bacterium]